MATLVDREAYVEQLEAMLPKGRAWPRGRGTVLHALIQGLATQLHDIDTDATGLLTEIRPSTTVNLLPDWERVMGLPDECSNLGSTIQERRAAVLTKLVSRLGMSAEDYKAIGRTFGVEIEVEELDQARAEAIAGLDTSNGKWRFVWWIRIPTTADIQYFDTLSDVLTPLRSVVRNQELECRLRKAAPAHTHLVLSYFNPPRDFGTDFSTDDFR